MVGLVLRASLPALLVCVVATAAHGQSGFVQGTVGADVRRFSAEQTETVFDGAARSLSAGVGGFLTPRVSASVELDAGASATTARIVSLTVAGRPATISTQYMLRRRSVSALFGVHSSGRRRVRLGAYAGLAFSSTRREVASDAPPIVLGAPAAPSVFVDRTVDLVAGADAAFTIAPRLEAVAALRAQGLALAGDLEGMSVRPAGGLRVSF